MSGMDMIKRIIAITALAYILSATDTLLDLIAVELDEDGEH